VAGKKEPEDDETKPTNTLTGVQAKVALAALKGDKTLTQVDNPRAHRNENEAAPFVMPGPRPS
jgi:hypothetical protein